MMNQYKLSREAQTDLHDIALSSEDQFGNMQRRKYVQGLQAKAQQIAARPEIGRDRQDLMQGLKSVPYVSHTLYYLVQEDGIAIVRILHKRMDAKAHLG